MQNTLWSPGNEGLHNFGLASKPKCPESHHRTTERPGSSKGLDRRARERCPHHEPTTALGPLRCAPQGDTHHAAPGPGPAPRWTASAGLEERRGEMMEAGLARQPQCSAVPGPSSSEARTGPNPSCFLTPGPRLGEPGVQRREETSSAAEKVSRLQMQKHSGKT